MLLKHPRVTQELRAKGSEVCVAMIIGHEGCGARRKPEIDSGTFWVSKSCSTGTGRGLFEDLRPVSWPEVLVACSHTAGVTGTSESIHEKQNYQEHWFVVNGGTQRSSENLGVWYLEPGLGWDRPPKSLCSENISFEHIQGLHTS